MVLRQSLLIIRISGLRPVELLFQGAVRPVGASVADIGDFQELPAFLLFEPVTERVAHTAVLAELVFLSGIAAPAEVMPGDRTGIAVDAGVVGDPAGTGLFADTVVPYFERNGRRMLVKRPSDV